MYGGQEPALFHGEDGRGIPVDKEPKTGLTGVEVVMTKLHAGGKFGCAVPGTASHTAVGVMIRIWREQLW